MARSVRIVTGLATVALAMGGTLAVAPSSQAASQITQPIDCPTAFPTSSAVKGVTGTGFTVESGTTPARFTATIIGRLTDGILPGTDLIIARISSPAVTRAHGIWAGISGSPVYATDGRLIGSTSYGLGINSDIAGLTPGSALLPVLQGTAGASAVRSPGPSRIALTRAQIRALVDAGVPAAAAAGGFSRIPLPVSISGKPTTQALAAINKIPDIRLVNNTARASGTAAKAGQIHAGGNFVAALAYGDASFSAAGTTTVVCGDKAVAFGHPFFDIGPVQYTAHPAEAVYVQPDTLFGAFKLVNPGGVAGVVDSDQNFGIRAVLGATPRNATSVTSSFRLGTHPVVHGSTTILQDQFFGIPFTALDAGQHVFINAIKTLGYEGQGTAKVTFVIKGVRGNGKAFSLTRSDVYSDPTDLPAALANTVFNFVAPLVSQDFENVHITSVAVSGTFETAIHRYRVTKVEAKQGSTWVTVGSRSIKATAGKPLALRLTLAPYKGIGANKVVPVTLSVPANAKGAPGTLELSAGAGSIDTSGASSVDQILSILGHVQANDEIRATLRNAANAKVLSAKSLRIGSVVNGYTSTFTVTIS